MKESSKHDRQEASQAPTQEQVKVAVRHEKHIQEIKDHIESSNYLDPTFAPSLVTGRCRCPACRAVRAANQV